jgi:nicotinate-nucleotide pyrophosphorylase (carboxylating)
MPERLDPALCRRLVREALMEDVGPGDVTTAAVVPPSARVSAVILTRAACVVAGLDLAVEVFAQVDPSIDMRLLQKDGDTCADGARIAEVMGPAARILTGERTALNFLQHLSGIATRTRAFVDAAQGAYAILDTRKTVPTMRTLAKYAVRCGGGMNHRTGLFDGVLIKDNHIRLAGGVAEAVRRLRESGSALPIEVEVETAAELEAALAAGVDVIMLDNMDDDAVRRSIALVAGRAKVELSGGMTIERVRRLSDCGADYVSIGAITHSAPAIDMSLEVESLLG